MAAGRCSGASVGGVGRSRAIIESSAASNPPPVLVAVWRKPMDSARDQLAPGVVAMPVGVRVSCAGERKDREGGDDEAAHSSSSHLELPTYATTQPLRSSQTPALRAATFGSRAVWVRTAAVGAPMRRGPDMAPTVVSTQG
jgi:hypothetical protein